MPDRTHSRQPDHSATAPDPVIAVIGCGNPARGDDGAGVEVVHRLADRFADHDAVRLIDAGTSGFEVLFRMRGAARVVIVDACRSGSEAGAVFHLPAHAAKTENPAGLGLHSLRWDHALYAGSRMFGAEFLDTTEVFLIEAQNLELRFGLSPPVEAGVRRVVREIATLLHAALEVH